MAQPYSENEPEEDYGPQIIGQVSGPLSWSEDERASGADGDRPACRRNGTPLPDPPRFRGR